MDPQLEDVVFFGVVDDVAGILDQVALEFVRAVFRDNVEFAEDLTELLVGCEEFVFDVGDVLVEGAVLRGVYFAVGEDGELTHPCAGQRTMHLIHILLQKLFIFDIHNTALQNVLIVIFSLEDPVTRTVGYQPHFDDLCVVAGFSDHNKPWHIERDSLRFGCF